MRHNLFNWCCHFAYGDAGMWLKCVWHPKNAIFTQNFAERATPDHLFEKRQYKRNAKSRSVTITKNESKIVQCP